MHPDVCFRPPADQVAVTPPACSRRRLQPVLAIPIAAGATVMAPEKGVRLPASPS